MSPWARASATSELVTAPRSLAARRVLGHVDEGDAEFGGALHEIRRGRGGCVGVVARGSQDLGRELTHGLDDHLLLVVGVRSK